MFFNIREAKESDSNSLTEISYAAKRYWNYPEEYFDIWKSELTITPKYINENVVYLAEDEAKVLGYFSIVENKEDFWSGQVFVKKGFWLEHVFIWPDYIGKRVGAELISFAKELCRKKNIHSLLIFSDPNAKGFYDKVGAKYIEESPSSIQGRTVSFYELNI